MIAIVDYGMGNLRSVEHALEFLGAPALITRDHDELRGAGKLILPGVGSFRAAIENIDKLRLRGLLEEHVARERPLLGICLGMQLLGDHGSEDGPSQGLGFVPGRVERFAEGELPVPHIGFNHVTFRRDELFDGLGDGADFYFVHSYRMLCADTGSVIGWCDYGERFAAAVRRGRVWGTQFHPEKSQSNGLRLLQQFVRLEA